MNRQPGRSLVELDGNGSSTRVLNLGRVHRRAEAAGRTLGAPLFRNSALDKAIILKHQIRAHERTLFSRQRSIATKIILPLDRRDLRLGGRSLFLAEERFESMVAAHFGSSGALCQEDRRLLDILDALPSLDPFLLREALHRNEIVADIDYFDISEADLRAMREVVEKDIRRLADLVSTPELTGVLTERLLFRQGEDYAPLRNALQLTESEYADGLFAWRGLLYYKWNWTGIVRRASQACLDMARVRPLPPRSSQAEAGIQNALDFIDRRLGVAFREVGEILELYDTYYEAFIEGRDPTAFKNFILSAPRMFFRGGELIGGVDHVMSYWAFRSRDIDLNGITQAEFAELLGEFEASLSGDGLPVVV